MTTPDRLKAWRAERGLSLDAAGALVGVTGVTWRSWEQGDDRPRAHRRDAVQIATGIDRDDWSTDEERALLEHTREAIAALDASSTGSPVAEVA